MQIFGIVRDPSGKPRFDEPANTPAEIKAMLTDADLLKLDPETVAALGMTQRLSAIKGEN